MSEDLFDLDDAFGEDYLYFYQAMLTSVRSDSDAADVIGNLQLPAGSKILDLACGHGRIANRLSVAGFEVFGLDRSEYFLSLARAEAVSLGGNATYVQGDMRDLKWVGEFDGIFIWFGSFGYFTEQGDQQVLEGCLRALRPGGKLVIDLINRDLLIRKFNATMVMERDGNFVIDRNRVDSLAGRVITERTVIRNKSIKRINYSMRLYTCQEILSKLFRAGFSRVDVTGPRGEPFDLEAPRLVVRSMR
jgi:SAM-dependent methyltransferase